MELGEVVSVDIIQELKHEEDNCPFCKEKSPPKEIENDFNDDCDEDTEAESGDISSSFKFKNDAGKLGKALGGKPGVRKVKIKKLEFDVSVAAHHLIPGNASLKKSKLFKSDKYLWKDGKKKGNIGYDINSQPNGVWSPGNYAARPWGTLGRDFFKDNGKKVTPKRYAFAAIKKWRCQFHDAHSDYSDFVKDSLNLLYEKLEAMDEILCPENKKKEKRNPEEDPPIYTIVTRLDAISARMKKMLVLPADNWKKNIYTSRFSKKYMQMLSNK